MFSPNPLAHSKQPAVWQGPKGYLNNCYAMLVEMETGGVPTRPLSRLPKQRNGPPGQDAGGEVRLEAQKSEMMTDLRQMMDHTENAPQVLELTDGFDVKLGGAMTIRTLRDTRTYKASHRAEEEVDKLARLGPHPFIAKVLSVSHEDKVTYIKMGGRGRNLRTWRRQNPQAGEETIRKISMKIILAIEHMIRLNVRIPYLSLEGILLDERLDPIFIDIGIGNAIGILELGVLIAHLFRGEQPESNKIGLGKGKKTAARSESFRDGVQHDFKGIEVSPDGTDFVMSMLRPDPKERPTLQNLCQHPWMDGMEALSAQISKMIASSTQRS